MTMQKKEMLKYINNGEIDFYHGLKFETKLDSDKLCQALSKRVDDVVEAYGNYIENVFRNDIEQSIYAKNLQDVFRVKNIDEKSIKAVVDENADIKDEICGIALNTTENGLQILPRTHIDEYFSIMRSESNYDFDFSRDVYGNEYVSSQMRIVLPPIKVKQTNSTIMLKAVIYVFKNKSAVLRITLPICNVESQPLKLNEINNYIQSAETIYGFPIQLKGESIEDIQECYCRFLAGTNKVKSVVCFKKIVNILLANYSGMVDDIKKIPDELKEQLYKISVAPVQDRKAVSYLDEAIKHLDKNGCFFNGIGYVLSSMGKCISFVDNSVLDFVRENFDEEIVFDKIITDLRRNVEFAIIILLLKNINDSYAFEQKELNNQNLSKVKNDYNRNKIFISELQTGVYGSVRELTNAFEEKMTYFLDVKNVEERMTALNNILDDEHAQRTLQLQNIISIVGLIFAVIFGLPAINETLMHIRKLCFFIKQDIPYVTIENISFIIWLLSVVCLFIVICRKSKK